MAKNKKKHICAECGEVFNHGISLRKHQRQSGHKGSEIVEDGGDDEGGEEASSPAPAAASAPPPPPPPPVPEPEPVAELVAHDPEPVSQGYDEDEDDQTVAVQRPGTRAPSEPTVPVSRPTVYPEHDPYPGYQAPPRPSRAQDTRTKLNLVSRGLKVVLSARAKDAGQQFKKSARSGADIFTEALKLAIALICFLAIPTFLFFWYKSRNPVPVADPNRPQTFSFDDGALAARSQLLKYLDHVGKSEMGEAYDLLSPEWQNDMSERSFKDAFIDIEDVRWAVTDQRLNDDGTADVLVRLAYREGGQARQFVGRFRLSRGSDGWRIDRTELSPEGR